MRMHQLIKYDFEEREIILLMVREGFIHILGGEKNISRRESNL